jgi:S-adenosylmethionine decarboxylase
MKKAVKRHIPFGLHVMLDMYDCSPEVLNDPGLVTNILQTLPEKLGMRILMGPFVSFAQPNGKRDPGGWTGVVVIQESHISIHTFIKRRFVTVDVYSCKQFDAYTSIEAFKQIFKTDDIEYTIETRGTKYPQEDID